MTPDLPNLEAYMGEHGLEITKRTEIVFTLTNAIRDQVLREFAKRKATRENLAFAGARATQILHQLHHQELITWDGSQWQPTE